MSKIELVLWFKCDCRCSFCVVDARTAAQSMPAAAAERHLRAAAARGVDEVDFGGGEPTLRSDLPRLAARARALGFRRIGVKTNGQRLCEPEYVSELLDAGVGRFSVPVWGHGPEVHDVLARTPGAFERLEMGVKNALDLGAEVSADVLLTRATVPRLRQAVERFEAAGVRRFHAWFYSLFGSAGALPSLLPSLPAAGAAVAGVSAALEGRGVRLATSQIPPCFLRPRPGLYRRISEERLEIITPGGSFPAESSPFEAGVKTRRCRGCAAEDRCAGVRPEYLARASDAEIAPLGREEALA